MEVRNEAITCFEQGIRCVQVAVCGRIFITGPQIAVGRPDLPLHEPKRRVDELLVESQQAIKITLLLSENTDEHPIPAHQLLVQGLAALPWDHGEVISTAQCRHSCSRTRWTQKS